MLEFVEVGDHLVILEAIKNFSEHEGTVLNGLKALLPLATSRKSSTLIILDQNVITFTMITI